jgi:4-amino-4-deoxy-L-arabinose transferase-like glycosyltransferase
VSGLAGRLDAGIDPVSERRVLLAILALAALLRLAFAPVVAATLGYLPDVLSYRTAAAEILSGAGIDSTLLMPGYPILVLLAGGGGIGQLVADTAFSVLSVWGVWGVTRAISDDTLAGLVAAFLWAIYPFSIFYAVVGLSESFFAALVLLGFFAYYRRQFSLGSLAMVVAILTRPAVELLTPLLILVFALAIHRLSFVQALKHLGIFAAIYAILMTPWWWHNHNKYGEFVRLNLAGGLVLYFGNNAENRDGGGVDAPINVPGYHDIKNPVEKDRVLQKAAVQFIIENPVRFVELAGLKFMRLWRPWPYASEYSGLLLSLISAISYLPVLAFAIAGSVWAVRRRNVRVLPIALFIGYITAIHMLTIGSLRYRFPIEPFLVILAAAPLAWAVRRILRSRTVATSS